MNRIPSSESPGWSSYTNSQMFKPGISITLYFQNIRKIHIFDFFGNRFGHWIPPEYIYNRLHLWWRTLSRVMGGVVRYQKPLRTLVQVRNSILYRVMLIPFGGQTTLSHPETSVRLGHQPSWYREFGPSDFSKVILIFSETKSRRHGRKSLSRICRSWKRGLWLRYRWVLVRTRKTMV